MLASELIDENVMNENPPYYVILPRMPIATEYVT